MPHRKITIKEMKQDRFRQAVFRAYDRCQGFVIDNLKGILIGLAAIALLSLGVLGWTSHRHSRTRDSRVSLARALQQLQQAPGAEGEGKKATLDKAAQALSKVTEDYAGTDGGIVAGYYLSVVRLEQGRPKKALEAARSFEQQNPDNPLRPLAIWVEARAYARLGQEKESVEAYHRLVDASGPLMTADMARFELAGYLERLGRTQEALAEYRKIQQGSEGTLKTTAENKIKDLEPLVAKGGTPEA